MHFVLLPVQTSREVTKKYPSGVIMGGNEMKARWWTLGLISVSLVMAGCGIAGQGISGASPVNGSYYTQEDAAHDREVALARREAELERLKRREAEQRAAEAERKAQRAQADAARVKEKAAQEAAAAQQKQEEARELGPEDFDSYAEYREYVDNRNAGVKRPARRETSSYSDGESRYDNNRSSSPVYSERYSDGRGSTTVNNYYIETPSQRYASASWNYWYGRPSYSYIVTFDPWFNVRYSVYRDWYDPYYFGYAYDPFCSPYPMRWTYEMYAYDYYYGYYGYYGYPYGRGQAWRNGYYWGYNDGYRDGYYNGGGYVPQASIPSPRRVEGVRSPRAASMSGYGRAQRSATAGVRSRAQSVAPGYSSPDGYGSSSMGRNGMATRTRATDAAPAYSNRDAGSDMNAPATRGANRGTATRTRATSTTPSVSRPTYTPQAPSTSYPDNRSNQNVGTRTRTRSESPSSRVNYQPAPSAPRSTTSAPATRTRTTTPSPSPSYTPSPAPSYSAPAPSSSPSTRNGTATRTRTR